MDNFYLYIMERNTGIFTRCELPFIPRIGDTIEYGSQYFKVLDVVIATGKWDDVAKMHCIELHVQKASELPHQVDPYLSGKDCSYQEFCDKMKELG